MERNKKQANKGKSKEKAGRGKSDSKDTGKVDKRTVCPSGYMLFSKDYREKNKSQKIAMKEIAEAWKNANEAEKAKWNQESQKMKSIIAANDDDEKQNKKVEKKPAGKAPKEDDKKDNKKKRSVSKNKKREQESEEEEDDD